MMPVCLILLPRFELRQESLSQLSLVSSRHSDGQDLVTSSFTSFETTIFGLVASKYVLFRELRTLWNGIGGV